MKTMRIAAALCALMPGVASAQTAPSAPVVATETAPPSQEALVEARKVAARLLPPGVYKTVMSGSMQAITGSMGDALKAMPLRQIAELGGLTPAEAKALDKVKVAQKATAGLPPVRKLDTMTPAERAKLAKALGVDPSKLHDPKVTS